METLCERTPHEPEFHQAVRDVYCDILPLIEAEPRYRDAALAERLCEPERVIGFRITWEDDEGCVHVNRGWRVQFNGAIGPYKGGLRFEPGVTLSVLKFLGFEQSFKNALTGLPMGGAKGGADFDPRGRSEAEVRRFCEAFMMELHRHIGHDTDVPAGDVNVGPREIGWMFGAYRRINNRFEDAITGKQLSFGGAEMRMEATGYGLVYFVCRMLDRQGESLKDRRVAISGAGNVATYAAEKAITLGARVVALSDSGGAAFSEDGFEQDDIDALRDCKADGGSLEAFAKDRSCGYRDGASSWETRHEVALPCAIENEVGEDEAWMMIDQGCRLVAEGANMPLTPDGLKTIREAGLDYAPAKAANAGGVAVSGLEIVQNRQARAIEREEIRNSLNEIMGDIHDRCAREGETSDGQVDYARGANIASFKKLADAMVGQGLY